MLLRHISPLLVLVLFVALTPAACSVRSGRCRCPGSSFQERYSDADSVVRAFVVRQWVSCHLCKPHDRRNAIRVTVLIHYKTFKGEEPRSKFFYTQAFDNVDYCGVRLLNNEVYMLNLANTRRGSKTSHWTPGIYVLHSCQAHWNWQSLTRGQLNFLYSRLRRSRVARMIRNQTMANPEL